MTWETTAWQPADEASLGSGAAVLPLWPMLQSALSEAVSAMIMGPAVVGDLEVAHVDATELPDGFVPVASFELMGTARRTSWAALDPSGGTELAGNAMTPAALQHALLEGLEGALDALVGEGLALGEAEAQAMPAGQLVLLRMPVSDPAGERVLLVAAFEEPVPAELAAHIVALQALAGSEAVEDAAPAPEVPGSLPETGLPAGSEPAAAAQVAPSTVAAGPGPSPAAAAPMAPAGPPAAGPAVAAASIRPPSLPELAPVPTPPSGHTIDLLLGVNLEVSVEIGRTKLAIRDVLALTPGSIVELDKLAGEKVDVLVNGHPIATGEVVVVDENFGVRIVEVVSRQHRIVSADHAA